MNQQSLSRAGAGLVKFFAAVVALLGLLQWASAQTLVDLKRQARNPDFSASNPSRIFPSGSTVPTTCVVGDTFLRLTEPGGAALYLCTVTDQWSKLGGAAESALTAGPGIVVTGSQISVEDAVVPVYLTGSGAPTVSCVAGRDRYLDIVSLQNWDCVAANQWRQVAHLNEANAWGSGKRQQMQPDATSAGLNVGVVASSPTTLLDGDIWYDSSAGKLQCRQGGVTVDCVTQIPSAANTQEAVWNEEFTRKATTEWGELGWELKETTIGDCSVPQRRTYAQHPGTLAIGVVSTLQSGCALLLGRTEAVLPSLAAVSNWEFRWVFAPDATDNVHYLIGVTDPLAGPGSASDAGAWIRISVSGGVVTATYEVGTGVATVTAAVPEAVTVGGTWYTFRLRSTSMGEWRFSLAQNGGAYGTEVTACMSDCTMAVTPPAVAVSPFAYLANNTGGALAHELLLDAWKGRMTVTR